MLCAEYPPPGTPKVDVDDEIPPEEPLVADELEAEYPLVPPYSRYAEMYDGVGQSVFSEALRPFVDLVCQRHHLEVKRVLDLACGTGTAAISFASDGCQVVGVDRSAAMLRVARQKAREAGLQPAFLLRNLSRFQTDTPFDLALCLYDSLNHLLRPLDLEAAFQAVKRALNPSGLFVFDVNTPYCMANDWGNRWAEERHPGSYLFHNYGYDPESRIATLEIFCLRRTGNGIERFREVHRERGYSREELSIALWRAGLELLEAYGFPDLDAPAEDTTRLLCVAGMREAGE